MEDSSQPARDKVCGMGEGGGGRGRGEGGRVSELTSNYRETTCLTSSNGCCWDVYTHTVDADNGSTVYVWKNEDLCCSGGRMKVVL